MRHGLCHLCHHCRVLLYRCHMSCMIVNQYCCYRCKQWSHHASPSEVRLILHHQLTMTQSVFTVCVGPATSQFQQLRSRRWTESLKIKSQQQRARSSCEYCLKYEFSVCLWRGFEKWMTMRWWATGETSFALLISPMVLGGETSNQTCGRKIVLDAIMPKNVNRQMLHFAQSLTGT